MPDGSKAEKIQWKGLAEDSCQSRGDQEAKRAGRARQMVGQVGERERNPPEAPGDPPTPPGPHLQTAHSAKNSPTHHSTDEYSTTKIQLCAKHQHRTHETFGGHFRFKP